MFYEFAKDITLDETREVVRQHNEALGVNAFIEADRGDFVIFNYIIQFDGAWPPFTGDAVNDRKAAILRELRGITFDKETGQVVLRKLHKFWNCGQNEESQPHQIDWTQPHTILSKADGSMVTPCKLKSGEIVWMTKMGVTDISGMVADFIRNNPQYVKLANWSFENNKTVIFEFCSRKNKVVIDHPVDRLILLAVRDNLTGEYLPY